MKGPQPTNIKEARLLKGLTKAELARQSGLDRHTVHRIEEGDLKTMPHSSTYGGLAEGLNLDPLTVRDLCRESIKG